MRYSTKMMGLGHGLSIATLSNLFLTLVEALLLLRVILAFFFTHNGSGFVHWCFITTNILLTPFRGIFTNPTQFPGGWYVDWVALFAMMVYAAFGSLLISWAAAGFGLGMLKRDRR